MCFGRVLLLFLVGAFECLDRYFVELDWCYHRIEVFRSTLSLRLELVRVWGRERIVLFWIDTRWLVSFQYIAETHGNWFIRQIFEE